MVLSPFTPSLVILKIIQLHHIFQEISDEQALSRSFPESVNKKELWGL